MLRGRSPKEEDLTEENLIGKPIVDPDGDIIGTCVELITIDKKKHMKISVKTEIDSEFIIDETIPVSVINKIGEVILLKKKVDIKPIDVSEIVSFEIVDKKQEKVAEEKEKTIEVKKENAQKKPNDSNKTQEKKAAEKKTKSEASKKDEQETIDVTIDKLWTDILTIENENKRVQKIEALIRIGLSEKKKQKAFLKLINDNLSTNDLKKRKLAADILIAISEEQPEYLIPGYFNWLQALYSEPIKEVESKLIAVLLKLSSLPKINLKRLYNFQNFFKRLYQKRTICNKVSLSRIHENNLKIFVNNLELQETLLEAYLSNILNKNDAANEFALFLKDFNAILVGYSLIKSFQEEEWKQILQSEIFQKSFKEAYLNSIEQILGYYKQGNVQKLSEIFNPKIGLSLSNKIIGEIIKHKIDEALSNISVLPLDVLCSFFQDDNNIIIKTVYDLINEKEINAQITFIGDKTYISAMDLKVVDLRN